MPCTITHYAQLNAMPCIMCTAKMSAHEFRVHFVIRPFIVDVWAESKELATQPCLCAMTYMRTILHNTSR